MNEEYIVDGYELVNHGKLNRVINGVVKDGGKAVGGVGRDAKSEVILSKYDSLGGAIKKNGRLLKSGCFWDFEEKKPKAKPEIVYLIKVGGETLEVDEEDAKTVEKLKEKQEKLVSKKKKKKGKRKLIKTEKKVKENGKAVKGEKIEEISIPPEE